MAVDQNPELLGVVVSVEEGARIQLLHDIANSRFIVRRLQTQTGVESGARYFAYNTQEATQTKSGAYVRAFHYFVDKAIADRKDINDFVPIEGYSLALHEEGSTKPDNSVEAYVEYGVDAGKLSEAMKKIEDAVISAGKRDIEELRGMADYQSSVYSLIRSSAELEGKFDIALLIY